MEHSIHRHISSSVHPCWFFCWAIRCWRGYHQRTSYARNGSSPPGCGRERRDNDPLHYRYCGFDVSPLWRYRSTCKTLLPTSISIDDGSCIALFATFFGALALTHTPSLILPPLFFFFFLFFIFLLLSPVCTSICTPHQPQVGVLLFAMGIVCTGVGQFFLGIALKKANRQSLIVLSMGSTIVLSAVLLTLRSFVDAFSRDGGLPALMALGQLCGSESSEDTGGGYMEGHAPEYADVMSVSPAAPKNSLPSSPDISYVEAPCLPGYEPPCYTRVHTGAGDGF